MWSHPLKEDRAPPPGAVWGLQVKGELGVDGHVRDTMRRQNRSKERKSGGDRLGGSRRAGVVDTSLGSGEPVVDRTPAFDREPGGCQREVSAADDLHVGELLDPLLHLGPPAPRQPGARPPPYEPRRPFDLTGSMGVLDSP